MPTKTIKQIADELGTNKQAVRRCMERCSIQAVSVNGVLQLTEQQYSVIFSEFAAKRNPAHVSEQNQQHETNIETNAALVALLKEQIRVLQKQLEVKDQQIKDLSSALVTSQQAAAAAMENARTAQALHAGTIQQQLTAQADAVPEKKKIRWPWQR